MKKVVAGILLGLCVLTCPIQSEAHERQCPPPIEISYEEAQELLKIAWCEAGNQGVDGQLYVMSVIWNRVNDPDFPDNIHDVIYESGQFATAGMKTATPTAETHYALALLESGNCTPQIIAFERTDSSVLDVYFSEAFNYRAHTFYTSKIN